MDDDFLKDLINEVNILLNKNLFKDALQFATLNCIKNPKIQTSPFFHNILGLIHLNLKDWETSIKCFEKSIEINRKFTPAYFNLGIAKYDLGDLKNSYEHFVKVIEFDKDNKRAEENIIKILNCIDLDKKDNPLTNANRELQKINLDIDYEKKISNDKIIEILNKSNSIISKFIPKYTFREHQLLFHNQKDLNCERHFRIFKKFNTLSKNCFNCFKIVIFLYDVYDLIKLSFIFNNLNFLNNFESKCRIDFNNNHYRGYIYCSSIDEINNVTKTIKNILEINFDEKFSIETRRGCSEFSVKYPNFKKIETNINDMFQYPKLWEESEKLIDQQTYKDGIAKIRNIKKPLRGITLNSYLIINNWLNYSKKNN